MTPLMPSPGIPNTVSTPQAISVSTRMSPAVCAIICLPLGDRLLSAVGHADAMAENEIAAAPAGEDQHQDDDRRERQSERQDRAFRAADPQEQVEQRDEDRRQIAEHVL